MVMTMVLKARARCQRLPPTRITAVPLDDVQEVSNYVAAVYRGLALLRDERPVSLRLVREIHKVLLGRRRGSDKDPATRDLRRGSPEKGSRAPREPVRGYAIVTVDTAPNNRQRCDLRRC